MRILFCNKYNFRFSGTEVYLFELMNLLRLRGHEVALFSMTDPRGEPTPFDQYFVPHIDFKDKNAHWTKRAMLAVHVIYSSEARGRLRNLVAAFRPDIAHVRNIYHHLSPSILWELKAQGVPVLYHVNDFKLICPAYNLVTNGRACLQPCVGRYWNILPKKCYPGTASAAIVLAAEAFVHHWMGTYRKCVDHFLAPSHFAKHLLVKSGFNEQAISVLPHFQELPPSPPPPTPDAPILYFGRLSPEKGVTDLVQAMRFLPWLRLRIAGDGPQAGELKSLTETLGLNNVEFVGHLTGQDLDRAIAGSCFTVLPSRAYETLGKSILESYAWARPVVASDLGSRREIVREGETGLLFEPANVEQLRATISTLATQPLLAAQMGAAGRRLVEEDYTADKHYLQLTELYAQMTAVHSARKRPVRLAFIGGRGVVSRYSGIETYYEEVGRELTRRGHEVTVYCRTYFTPSLGSHNGMRLVRLPTIRSKHLETLVHTLLSSAHVMFTRNDIVHYHALGPALFSWLPRLVGKKTLVTVQGLDWQRQKWGPLAAMVLRRGEIAAAHFPHQTMVVSHTLQEYFRSHHHKDTVYIPNGTTIRPRSAPSQIPLWGLDPDHYALFLGRFSPEKNCHLLIEAYEKLETDSKLVLAGGSSHTDVYAAQLRRHANERILLLDWQSGDPLNELLTNAAVFVLPSDLEGLSLALLDAMGAGICVLTSDIPENLELVEGTGLTFHAGDVDDLSRMLGLLLSDPALRAATGKAAQELVRERYLWPDIAVQIEHVYEKLLGVEKVGSKVATARVPSDQNSASPRKPKNAA